MENLEGFDKEAYRKRIRVLRKLFNLNQVEFAKKVGIPFKRWHHYESGYPIPRDTAFILRREIPGISTDWIWFGDDHGVEPGLLQQIRAIEQAETRLGPPRIGEPEHARVVARVVRRKRKKKTLNKKKTLKRIPTINW